MLSHPAFGTACYPASLLTNAPEQVLRDVLRSTLPQHDIPAAAPAEATSGAAAGGAAAAGRWMAGASGTGRLQLELLGLTAQTWDGRPAVRDLSLQLSEGERLLVRVSRTRGSCCPAGNKKRMHTACL